MRNVVLITGGFNLPYGNASAIRALSIARCLKVIGYEPVVAGVFEDKGEKDNLWTVFDGVRCFNMGSVSTIASDISYLDSIFLTYDPSKIYSIIAYNYPGVALFKLWRNSKVRQIKVVSDTTEWYAFNSTDNSFVGSVVRWLHTELRMRWLNRRIGNIICTTNYIANYYRHSHTMVIPAIDDHSFDDAKHTSHIHTNSHTTKFFYAGSPGYKFRKDRINLVVQMFERLSVENIPFHFDIYGVSSDEYVKFFGAPKTKQNEIVFHGRVSRQVILEQLKQSDFSVLLRPNDRVCKVGFSSKSMESISAGVPLIANDVNGDFSKYFTQNQALLCDAEDMDAFYSLLKKACTMTDDEIVSMKESCVKNNPFDYKNYIEPLSFFMKGLK